MVPPARDLPTVAVTHHRSFPVEQRGVLSSLSTRILRPGQDARRKIAAPFVLVDIHGSILGYYTLSSYSIRLDALPNVIGKRLPRYPLIPPPSWAGWPLALPAAAGGSGDFS